MNNVWRHRVKFVASDEELVPIITLFESNRHGIASRKSQVQIHFDASIIE